MSIYIYIYIYTYIHTYIHMREQQQWSRDQEKEHEWLTREDDPRYDLTPVW